MHAAQQYSPRGQRQHCWATIQEELGPCVSHTGHLGGVSQSQNRTNSQYTDAEEYNTQRQIERDTNKRDDR